jgi:hypothetical protein
LLVISATYANTMLKVTAITPDNDVMVKYHLQYKKKPYSLLEQSQSMRKSNLSRFMPLIFDNKIRIFAIGSSNVFENRWQAKTMCKLSSDKYTSAKLSSSCYTHQGTRNI